MGHPLYRVESDEFVIIEDLNIEVPAEMEEDFLTDGIDALTRYKAEPPLTEGGFFENPQTIAEAVDRSLSPIIASVGERIQVLEHAVDDQVRRYVTREIEFLPPRVEGRDYFMHGDPGLSKDSFTIAVAHTMPDVKVVSEAKGKTIESPRVVVDFVLSWDPRPMRVVDFLNVDDTIKEVARFYGIKRMTFDRWNSVHTIQELVAMGVDATDMSFSNEQQLAMYKYLRLSFYNDMINLAPGDETTQRELQFIREKNGKIIHDIYGKDRADAVAAVVWNAAGRSYSKVRARCLSSDSGGPQVRTLPFVTERDSRVIGSTPPTRSAGHQLGFRPKRVPFHASTPVRARGPRGDRGWFQQLPELWLLDGLTRTALGYGRWPYPHPPGQ